MPTRYIEIEKETETENEIWSDVAKNKKKRNTHPYYNFDTIFIRKDQSNCFLLNFSLQN